MSLFILSTEENISENDTSTLKIEDHLFFFNVLGIKKKKLEFQGLMKNKYYPNDYVKQVPNFQRLKARHQIFRISLPK